jgi:hypothetical protein
VRYVPTVRAALAGELRRDLPLSAHALSFLERHESLTPAELLDHLGSAELFSDAVMFLAHAIGPVDAIWWGLGCALAVEEVCPDPAVSSALDLLGDWSLSPSVALEDEARAIARLGSWRSAHQLLGLPLPCRSPVPPTELPHCPSASDSR